MAFFSLRYWGDSLRMNVLCAQPESGRKGVDWLLDESSLLTAPFIHIVKLTKPGNSRTSSSLLHSWEFGAIIILYFIVALLHSTSLAFVFAQGRDDHYFADKKHIPEIMTILTLELWTWDKCELHGWCYERIHTAPGTAMLTSMDAASSPSLVPFPLFQSTSGRCRSL